MYYPSTSTSTNQANEVDADSVMNNTSGNDSSGDRTPESDTNIERPLLLVKLTGYRLLGIGTVIAFATAKAVLASKSPSLLPTLLDLVSVVLIGVVCASAVLVL
jgi:hypothetical protein